MISFKGRLEFSADDTTLIFLCFWFPTSHALNFRRSIGFSKKRVDFFRERIIEKLLKKLEEFEREKVQILLSLNYHVDIWLDKSHKPIKNPENRK